MLAKLIFDVTLWPIKIDITFPINHFRGKVGEGFFSFFIFHYFLNNKTRQRGCDERAYDTKTKPSHELMKMD